MLERTPPPPNPNMSDDDSIPSAGGRVVDNQELCASLLQPLSLHDLAAVCLASPRLRATVLGLVVPGRVNEARALARRKSLIFMRNGEAFEAYREILIGKKVQLHGLVAMPELNNTMGTVTIWDSQRGRYGVRTREEGVVALKPANLQYKAPLEEKPARMSDVEYLFRVESAASESVKQAHKTAQRLRSDLPRFLDHIRVEAAMRLRLDEFEPRLHAIKVQIHDAPDEDIEALYARARSMEDNILASSGFIPGMNVLHL